MVKVFSPSEFNKKIINYCKIGDLKSLRDMHKMWGPDIIFKAKDSKNMTGLFWAMAHEQKEIVQFFIESLGYFKEISVEQDCLHYLHMAADLGRIDFVNILIENGLKINEQDRNGYSPLHFACFRGHKLMVDHLLRLGADPKLRNIYWRTPAEEARTRGNNDIASFIDNYVTKQ